MITGANSGFGRTTALGLAEMGASVVMVCRNREWGEEAVSEMKAESGNRAVDLLVADLSSQASVRELVDDFRASNQYLHVLINNADNGLSKRALTADGFGTVFAANYLAPFLLTSLLLDLLQPALRRG